MRDICKSHGIMASWRASLAGNGRRTMSSTAWTGCSTARSDAGASRLVAWLAPDDCRVPEGVTP